MQTTKIGNLSVTRLVMGGNPFSGFSHQSPVRDAEMVSYYTFARIKETLRLAEAAGINTVIARNDHFITRLMQEYWSDGGRIQWIAQTCSELKDQIASVRVVAKAGAKGVYLHGGTVDYWYSQKRFDLIEAGVKAMRDCGVAAGVAGHTVEVHTWIRDHLDVDFQMCSYYDPSSRATNPSHIPGYRENWDMAQRDRMAALIQTIAKPVMHYKVFAAGNLPVDEGFQFLARTMRPGDAVCIGHYLKGHPNQIAENVATFERLVECYDLPASS